MRDKRSEELFRRKYELLDKRSLNEREEAELEEIRAQIEILPTAQFSDDQKAMDFIREAAVLLNQRISAE